MTRIPSTGDLWEWEDGELHLLCEKLPYYRETDYRFACINLTTGDRDSIVFTTRTVHTPGNFHRWRYVA